ncbi:MAG TPA: putative Ig domain-containing protein [Verrucomicrobiae bacterium]|jgi:hypothetical protein
MKRTVSLLLMLAALRSWGAVTGQLWYGAGYGLNADSVIGHINSDDSSAVITQRGGSIFRIAVAVDPAAGFYWSIDPATGSAFGTPSSDPTALSLLEYRLSDNTLARTLAIGDSADQDVVESMAIDPANHIIFVSEWGYNQARAGIEEVTYDPATGAMSGGSNNPVFLVNNANFSGLDLVEYMSIDLPNHKLYFVDNDNGYSLSPFSPDNAVYVVDYSVNSPVPIKLTSNASVMGGFPTGPGVGEGGGTAATDDPGGLLAAVAVNGANQLVYFTTCQFTENGTNTTQDALWYVNTSTTGQTAAKVALPANVTLNYPGENSGLSFDPIGRHLYIADLNRVSGAHSRILDCALSADGKSIASVKTNNMATLTGNANPNQGAGPTGTTFTSLPVPTLAASASYIAGNAPVALSPAMTITAATDGYLRGATVSIAAGLLLGDTLSATTFRTSIASTYNAATGVLTLANYDTLANYQAVLRSVAYSSANIDPGSNGTDIHRTLTWTLDDGQPSIPAGSINSSNLTLGISSPPSFTSASGANFTVGVPGTFTVASTGYPKPALAENAADTLPAGVSFLASTGVLSGTPAAGSGGSYTLNFTAQNGVGNTVTQIFILAVNQAPVVTCPSNIVASAAGGNCLVPALVSFAATATGFPVPTIAYFNGSNAITSPAAFPVGATTVTSVASNVLGTNSCSFTITVTPGPPPQLAAMVQGTNLVVSWPDSFACYTLQTSEILATNGWSNYPGPFGTNDGAISITNGISANSVFFRLKD